MSNLRVSENLPESSNPSSSSQKSNPKFKSRIWKRTEKKTLSKKGHKQRSHSHFHDTSSISNDSSLEKISVNSQPARLYSDVVAFGNEAPTRVSHIVPARKKLSKKKNIHRSKRSSFEGFPPLANYEGVTAFSDDDYVGVDFEKPTDEDNKMGLRRLLNIKIDDFNFTEIDDDPNSTSIPRFVRIFEDDDYLKLEQKVLQNYESEI
ncbi:hypothetical protein ACFFRR_008499 [Megaselia abdita]